MEEISKPCLGDPGETNNVYLEHPEIVARLTAELQEIVGSE